MKIDTWCFAQPPGEKRVRGRLVTYEGRLLLLSAGPTVRDLGALESLDVRRRTAVTDLGEVRWQPSCSCGWPTSLKGPVGALLERAGTAA